MSTSGSSTPILFLHGAWHGSWCWAEVLARVTGAGTLGLAVDMAGHGLRARHPAALTRLPFDASLLASEPCRWPTRLDQAGELLVSQIEQLGAGDPVIVVAHSAGGAVFTWAAQQATALVAHAVYLTAFMLAFGVPLSAYTRMPEHEGGLVRPLAVADPAAVGALRLDVASPDPRYRQRLREAFYGDVDRAVADAAIALLTPDAPAGISAGTTMLTAAGCARCPAPT